MAEYRAGIHHYDSEQCRQLLSALAGVYAAGVRFEDDQLVEIHVLASIDRNPKQVSRDVQSVLFAAYGVEVDHRIISIAQLPDNPFVTRDNAAEDENKAADAAEPVAIKTIRPLFTGIESSQKDGVYHISIQLSCGDQIYTGSSSCRDTVSHRNRAAAEATIAAVHSLLGHDYFTLIEVRQINVWDVTIMLTVLEYQEYASSRPSILTGAAVQHDDSSSCIVRSTLDGLNRCISRLYDPHII